MRKKQNILLMITLIFAASLFISDMAVAKVDSQVKLLVNTGKVLVINFQGERQIYSKNEEGFLLSPQSIVIPQEGICVVKAKEFQFIVEPGDILSFRSEEDMRFSCLSGAIEVIGGEKTYKLTKNEEIAMATSIQDMTVSSQEMIRTNDQIYDQISARARKTLTVINPNFGTPGEDKYISPYEVKAGGAIADPVLNGSAETPEKLETYASPYF